MNDEKEFLKLTETGRKFLGESMKYESPITKIYGEIQNEIIKQDEEHLMYSVNQSVGYQVDKDELIKTLQYDREQYTKGYSDCKIDMVDKVKKAREEISDRVYRYSGSGNEVTQAYCDGFKASLEILDELIESEEK